MHFGIRRFVFLSDTIETNLETLQEEKAMNLEFGT